MVNIIRPNMVKAIGFSNNPNYLQKTDHHIEIYIFVSRCLRYWLSITYKKRMIDF